MIAHRTLLLSLAGVIFCGTWSKPALATVPIVEGESFQFSLSGYLRSLTGDQYVGYDTLGLVPDHTGLTIDVLRLEWSANLGERVTLQIHDRFLWSATTASESFSEGGLGIGASTPPGRWIDLESTFLDEDNVRLSHDVDRLMLRLFLDEFDVTVGRQAVTWGIAKLFPVADLWTQFSPFELDTSEKRGIDAIRVLTAPTGSMELDFILADRGTLEDLSGGARAVLYLEKLDLHLAAGKLWNQVLLFAGLTTDLDQVGLYLDLTWGYHLDDEEFQLPRVAAGIDIFAVTDLVLALEYHFNGLGESDPGDYLTGYAGEAFSRGETYLVGRHYAGLLASYTPTALVTLTLSTIANLLDPSLIVSPGATYNISDNVDISAGAYLAFGEQPTIALPPTIGSEFGTYPDLFFVHLSAFF